MKNFRFTLKTLLKIGLALALVTSCTRSAFTANSSVSAGDPFLKYAWHLSNTGQKVFAPVAGTAGFDMNLTATWRAGIVGSGVQIQVSDDGLDDNHEDIKGNFPYLNESKNYTISSPYLSTIAAPISVGDNHGTAVAGLIAAVGNNGLGAIGVAPGASLTIANFLSTAVSQSLSKELDQASGNFDISNMSWGFPQYELTPIEPTYEAQLKSMVTTKRGGKGAIFVKAAGNEYLTYCNGSATLPCVGSSNFDGDNVLPYLIVVAALNAKGEQASYSSNGSDIWISAFGGEYGDDTPAMLTTDRTGCTQGYAKSGELPAFDGGTSGENPTCSYTSTFNGTSSAAPTLTGAVALLLDANPNLTWREIKYILATTATVDGYTTDAQTHPLGLTMPTGYDWDQKWITNAAQFRFHNAFGFGRVNVDAAVTRALSLPASPLALGTYTETNWAHANTGLSTAIPDNSATGASNILNVATALTIEAVQIKVSATHPDISELALELTSPSGTRSVLVPALNALTGIPNFVNDVFLTNAFYQETTVGNWTLKVIDAKTGNSGTLTSFSLNFYGGAH